MDPEIKQFEVAREALDELTLRQASTYEKELFNNYALVDAYEWRGRIMLILKKRLGQIAIHASGRVEIVGYDYTPEPEDFDR